MIMINGVFHPPQVNFMADWQVLLLKLRDALQGQTDMRIVPHGSSGSLTERQRAEEFKMCFS